MSTGGYGSIGCFFPGWPRLPRKFWFGSDSHCLGELAADGAQRVKICARQFDVADDAFAYRHLRHQTGELALGGVSAMDAL